MPSQFNEDELIAQWLPPDAARIYIDVGAAHPEEMSNTHLLHEQGFVGLCVEPVHAFAELLRQARCQARPRAIVRECVVGDCDLPLVPFCEVEEEPTLSTCDAVEADARRSEGRTILRRRIEFRTLASLLIGVSPQFLTPGLCSIDVEGMEFEVLRGCPWGAGFSPSLILVESTMPNTDRPSYHSWEPILLGRGYRHVASSPINRLYLRGDRP